MKHKPKNAMVVAEGVYQHYKGGQYRVMYGNARASNNDEREGTLQVVYMALADGKMYVRDVDEFLDFEDVKGEAVRRFAWVGP